MLNFSLKSLVLLPDAARRAQLSRQLSALRELSLIESQCDDFETACRTIAKESVDLVLCPCSFPGTSEEAFLAGIRSCSSDPIVLMFLEPGERSDFEDAPHEGADEYFFWDELSPEKLAESLRLAVERRNLLRELRQGSEAAPVAGVFRGLLHQLDTALFLVDRSDGSLAFSNEVADAWCGRRRDFILQEVLEYGVLEDDFLELEIQLSLKQMPYAAMRSVAVEWRGRACVLVTLRDISRRKSAERAYRESQQHLEFALRTTDVGLWTLQVDSGKMALSDRWRRQLGYRGIEIEDTFESFCSVLHPEDVESVKTAFAMLPQGVSSEIETQYRMRHRDGKYRRFVCRAEVSERRAGRCVSVIGSQQEMLSATSSRVAADAKGNREGCIARERVKVRMQSSKQDFVAAARGLKKDLRGDSSLYQRIQNLERVALRFYSMADVLEGTGREGTTRPCDLADAVAQVGGLLESLLPERVTLLVHDCPSMEVAGWSPRSLELLLSEAFAAVADHVNSDFRSELAVRCVRSEGVPVLRFSYSGTLLSDVEGAVLESDGVSSVRRFSVGQLSVLELRFGGEEPQAATSLSAATGSSESRRVLLAEDEGILRMAIKAMLESLGYRVDVAADGEAAVTVFEDQPEAYAFALLDLQMPLRGGLEVGHCLREMNEELPIVLMSGDSLANVDALLDTGSGNAAFLCKPFSVKALEAAIQQVGSVGLAC